MTEGSGLARRQRGAWYTPPELVELVVSNSFEGWELDRFALGRPGVRASGRPLSVLDPACGDGRFLLAAGRALRARGIEARLVGVDVSKEAVAAARATLRAELDGDASIIHDDALKRPWDGETFDLVVGNPPFLSPLSTSTPRPPVASGAYSDVAVEFLALAMRLISPGGRIGLILPQSVLASRDAGVVRREAEHRCRRTWSWWSRQLQFDANVVVCALGFEARGDNENAPTEDDHIRDGASLPDADERMAPRWTDVVTDALGVPRLDVESLSVRGVLGDRASLNANFRDEYYGLLPAVVESPRSRFRSPATGGLSGVDGRDRDAAPPVITSGLIDPGRCHWGTRSARYGKKTYDAPRAELSSLDPKMREWAAAKLVPKVLVANQTKIIEAVPDPQGAWLPAVPITTIVPTAVTATEDLPEPIEAGVWEIAAVLTSPVASVWAWHELAGTGMSARALRVGPRVLARLPWPAGPLGDAVDALRSGDIPGCGRAVSRAYGVPEQASHPVGAHPAEPNLPTVAALMTWWLDRFPAGSKASTDRDAEPSG